jgi:hypothetical protein
MTPPTYAMSWWLGDGPRSAGRVELSTGRLALAATTPTAVVEHIALRDVGAIALLRGILELERPGLPTVRLRSLDRPGALRELHDRLLAAS